MNLIESIRIALTAIATNRLRSMLTILGIIIGVGAVIGLVSLGRGVESFIAAEFEDLGSNLLVVNSARPNSPTRTRIEPLTMNEAAALANKTIAPSIRQVAAEYRLIGLVVGAADSATLSVKGVTPNFVEVRSWYPELGSFITDYDVDNASRVAVLGKDAVKTLFGDAEFDPTGQTIRINERVFTVVGVMARLDSAFTDDDVSVIIPITTAQTRLANARARDGSYIATAIFAEAVAEDAMTTATREIEAYLTTAHEVIFEGEQDFQIINQADILDFVRQLTGILTIFLSMIAGISLLVGGIGIMNIMLVTVTERTREIGLRKAVGARGSDIMMQFLIESLILSFVGGILGIALGWAGAQLGTALIDNVDLVVTPDAIILATSVSGFIGIFFGLYPASRAARLRPIDALRFE
ncbi:MAG: ABC transporter permease [Anaerolineae bacterium]|nr:ABC transporter permease [Anaerolineae bacterium]